MNTGTFIALTAVCTAVFLAGCATKNEPLPRLPGYPPLTKTFDTSDTIYLYPANDEKVGALVRNAFRKYGYLNLPGDLPEKPCDPEKARFVVPVDVTHKISKQPDGKYLITRIIVSVRKPGTLEKDNLKCPGGKRTFQASAILFLGEKKADENILLQNTDIALEHLFTIEGFREAL